MAKRKNMPQDDASERELGFVAFCRRMIGTQEASPVPNNGTTIKSLIELHEYLYPEPGQTKTLRLVQDFSDSIYDEPNVCYVIHQMDTGRRYIGKTSIGFRKRYPQCRWWDKTHSKRLADDVVIYGLASFRVMIYVCNDELEMDRMEASLLTANRLFTYNIRPEPDNQNQAPASVVPVGEGIDDMTN